MPGDVAVQDPVPDPQHGGGGTLLSLPSSLLFMPSTNSQLTVAICVYH